MTNPYDSNEKKLQRAAGFIKAGQKENARLLLRDILVVDQNNLVAWELLAYATHNIQEETYCLKRILSLRADHPWARQRLAEIAATPQTVQAAQETNISTPASAEPKQKPPATPAIPAKRSRRKRREWAPILIGVAIVVGILAQGIIILRFGLQPTTSSAQLTMTAAAGNSALCQEIITRALEASGSYCDQFDSNNICYGNKTLLAELIPEASQRFSERGDVVGIDYLQRLSVSPLNLEAQEWGIAILKVMANLPRSLPGETVTLMVFGNTTLDNAGQNFETFYFSSGLGEIVCEEVPFDGIMISMPDGTGIQFMVNNAELILMGNASLSAVQNGDMEVSLFSGSGQITSMGEAQSFGAGQQVSILLGGTNGMEAVSVPSTPMPLSPDDLILSCTLTGEYCDETDLQPISDQDIELTLEAGFQFTPSLQQTSTFSQTASLTQTPGITLTPSMTLSPTRTGTRTRTPSVTMTLLHTYTTTRTPTQTSTLLHTYTPTRTPTLTSTLPLTNTPTRTPTYTLTPVFTGTPTLTFTASQTSPPANTRTFTPVPACQMTAGGLGMVDSTTLSMSVTNNGASGAVISDISIGWIESSGQKLLVIDLDGDPIANVNDADSPSSVPGEFPFSGPLARRTIPASSTKTLTISFLLDLEPSGYDITISFGPGCQVQGSR